MIPNIDSEFSIRAILRSLSRNETGILVRLALSLISGLFFAASAVLSAWGLEALLNYGITLSSTSPFGFLVAILCWFLSLVWIWSGTVGARKPLVRAIISTMITWAAAVVLCITIAVWIRGDEEILIGGTCLLAAAVSLLFWLPMLQR